MAIYYALGKKTERKHLPLPITLLDCAVHADTQPPHSRMYLSPPALHVLSVLIYNQRLLATLFGSNTFRVVSLGSTGYLRSVLKYASFYTASCK
jgi:hypothetical protein